MRISDIGGEDTVVRLIGERYGAQAEGDLALGIGDDAALLWIGDKLLIVTTDLLIENTHFRTDINEPYLLGWKSAAVNISDIAAMGGEPTYAFVSIGLPDVNTKVVQDIYDGLHDACAAYGCAIAGGDTVGSSMGIVINVALLGEVEPELATRRSGAKVGDAIIVTSTLGDSRAGLQLLLKFGLEESRRISPFLVERHLKPTPRVAEASVAVKTGKVTSMMDLSDGLSMDLARLCRASGVGARVRADKLPISNDLKQTAGRIGADPKLIAASGGEDYELLLTCAQPDTQAVTDALAGSGSLASCIGEIVDGNTLVLIDSSGRENPMPGSWKHFPAVD